MGEKGLEREEQREEQREAEGEKEINGRGTEKQKKREKAERGR